MKQVSTSILCKEDSIKVIERLNNSNTDYIHLDVMDKKFVNNKFLSINELHKYIPKIKKNIDVHLMVKDPKKYIEELQLYDISYITIHYETKNYLENINLIKSCGLKAGISIKLETDVEEIYPLLDKVSLVLIMSVTPGASGQSFQDVSGKISKLKKYIEDNNLNVLIEVDGGINEDVLDKIKDADIIVSASYVLDDLNRIDILKNI